MHEYKSLITGKISAGEVSEDKICGVLCILLEQFLDTRPALSFIGDAAGHVDLMTEEYFLDAYLGILPQKDEQQYGPKLLTCADRKTNLKWPG